MVIEKTCEFRFLEFAVYAWMTDAWRGYSIVAGVDRFSVIDVRQDGRCWTHRT